jgi:hypothetical protein
MRRKGELDDQMYKKPNNILSDPLHSNQQQQKPYAKN